MARRGMVFVLLPAVVAGSAFGAETRLTNGPTARAEEGKVAISFAVSDTHAYVADTVSRRVVEVKLAYAAQETCEVKGE